MVLRKYQDAERDRETLIAVREARGAMEAVEAAFFKEGTATVEDVDRVRDAYWKVWEERRNFVLSEKFHAPEKAHLLAS